MRIQHNIMAMSAYRNYTNNVAAMKKNLEKLSSGYKINRAGDDAAGLAISEKMRAQITGLETAQKNAKDGISLVQTAEGALTEVHDMLNRMVELATQSANGTYDNTTDRAQMQKEVDQLLSEINRIADSSNFNGINLLDGSLGLNTDAFDVGASVGAETAVAPAEITGAVTAASINATDTHYSATAAGQDPSFSIDFADLKMVATGSNDATFKVTIGSGTSAREIAVNLGPAGTTTATKAFTASEIAAAVASAFNTLEDASGNANGAGFVNGLVFKASAAGGKVTFTYEGVANGTAGTATGVASTPMTASQASTFNKLFGGGVAISSEANFVASKTTGRLNCDILEANEAKVAGDPERAGISFTLAASAIADGNTITIDGTEFKIKMSGTGAAGASEIDLRDLVKAGASSGALLRETVLQLSNKTTTNFTIHTKDADAGVIHLEQTLTSYASGTGKLYGYDELSKLVSVKDAGTPAKNAGTKLDLNAANVKAGNVLKIGEGTNAVEVKFEAGDTTASKVQARIQAALGSNYTVEIDSAATDIATGYDTRIVIRGADPAATSGPQILGKGLTLQIGDTSDDFNQLNVAVQDMHAENLGIGNLDISTEEAAQAAIKKIKDAINTVSDVRGTLGATQNRLDHTINNLSVMTENIQDAESTIRDVDVAEEMMAYTKNNILIQSAQAMLAQANQVPQGVLQLLQ